MAGAGGVADDGLIGHPIEHPSHKRKEVSMKTKTKIKAGPNQGCGTCTHA
jgi:hypothetical protein